MIGVFARSVLCYKIIKNMYSSRSKFIELNSSHYKSPSKDMNHCFKGFSFYSEPKEEIEVQRQIKEYLRLKTLYKKKYQENEQRK